MKKWKKLLCISSFKRMKLIFRQMFFQKNHIYVEGGNKTQRTLVKIACWENTEDTKMLN